MLTQKFLLKKIGKGLLHLLFWCGVLLFYSFFFAAGNAAFNDTLAFSLFLMPITIATTYVSIYKLIPDYLITKRYFRFTFYSLSTLIISGYLVMVSIFFSLIYLSGFEYSEMNPSTKNILYILTAVYLVVFIVSAFKLLKLNLSNITKANVLEQKMLEAQLKLKEQELHYLKMQIQPHFLFNTLNTLYGFALKKADKTPEIILKLSNLLDYLLYQVDKPFVTLKDEINHIRDYIALEEMRFNDTLDISFNDDTTKSHLKIAPMLFLPFVENSFKHGAIVNGKLQITINIKNNDDLVILSVKNTINAKLTETGGIGLDNITKRLELLYKNNYDLKISPETETYKVTLTLNTNNEK